MNHSIFFLHLTALIAGIISNLFLFLSYKKNRKYELFLYNLFWGNFTLLFLYNFLSSYGDVSGWSVSSLKIPLLLIGISLKYSLIVISVKLLLRLPGNKAKRNRFTLFAIFAVLIIGPLIVILAYPSDDNFIAGGIGRISDMLLLLTLAALGAARLLIGSRENGGNTLLKKTSLVLITSSLISILIGITDTLADSAFIFWDISFAFLCFYGLWSLYLVFYLGKTLYSSEIPSLDNLDDESLIQRGITAREKEILQSLVKGLNRREIAEKEYISPRTVDNHIGRIYRKFEVNDRVELIRKLLNE